MSQSMGNQKVKVSVTYEWEFNHKEWNEFQSWVQNNQDIIDRVKFDVVDAFHHLNQICRPSWDCKAEPKELSNGN
jgi:hypothetical protein